jgi:hypothetical protein
MEEENEGKAERGEREERPRILLLTKAKLFKA